ncbi:MAG: hypothetical protein H9893_10855 [Candidatus Niameybacter stercoravium]|nr:hypothetical protein [Candidatus Niameybacter stercoravium]
MSKKLLVMLTAMGTLSVTLVAAPIVKNVTAKIDPAISFELNGEKVMSNSEALMYNNTLYVPVRELGETLDAEITYKDKVVSITTEETTPLNTRETQEPATEIVPALEAVTIDEATIMNVDVEGKQVSVLPAGKEDVYTNYIILNISEDTALTQDGTALTLNDLVKGMKVSVTHSSVSTRSLPPQTAAFTLNVLTEAEVKPLENVTLEDVQVVEVNETKFGYSVLVGRNENPEDIMNQTILHINEETVIKHEKNKAIYKASDLEKGMKLKVVHSPIMTLSIPGQTTAIEITILAQ